VIARKNFHYCEGLVSCIQAHIAIIHAMIMHSTFYAFLRNSFHSSAKGFL
jgi:hypothetical protein